MKDCHVHANISYNGISTINEYLDMAKKNNIDEITFVEHYGIHNGIETLDIDYYLNEYIKYFKDSRAKTNFGLEIDLNEEKFYRVSDMVIRYPFDFIIASSKIKSKKNITQEIYLKEILESIKAYNNEFDVYSYFDYILRYDEYKEIWDEILINLIEKNKGIELNTSKLLNTSIDVLKRYRKLGGRIVTIGSNAHKASELGSRFDIAINMLQDVGFDEVAVYHKRKPNFVKIKEFTINH